MWWNDHSSLAHVLVRFYSLSIVCFNSFLIWTVIVILWYILSTGIAEQMYISRWWRRRNTLSFEVLTNISWLIHTRKLCRSRRVSTRSSTSITSNSRQKWKNIFSTVVLTLKRSEILRVVSDVIEIISALLRHLIIVDCITIYLMEKNSCMICATQSKERSFPST